MKAITLIIIPMLISCSTVQAKQPLDVNDGFEPYHYTVSISQMYEIISKAGLDDEHCNNESFTTAKRGNLVAIYTNDDSCDGGNSFGIVVDETLDDATVFNINDSWIVKTK